MARANRKSERIALLDGVAVDQISHFGRTLKDHLIGTHNLLDQWGNADHVCLAGLFHSVYGTKTFPQAALTSISRDNVRALIGEQAELLVYMFCKSDRRRLLLENRSAPYRWIDHRTGERADITGVVLNELVEMEVANFVEQLFHRNDKTDTLIDDMRHRFETTRSRMSVAAREAFRAAIDRRAEKTLVRGAR